MPFVTADGIRTRYEVTGKGPALLMYSPGGFESRLENWNDLGAYRRLGLIDSLAERFTCIRFDRRESGESSGRVERITWADYVAQGQALLDALGIEQAHAMGGCIGCSSALGLAAALPDRILSMVLFSPAGGVRYRRKQHERFRTHLEFAREVGLAGVVELALGTESGFTQDARVGPWAGVIRRDAEFAASYAALSLERYETTVDGISRVMYDRDTVPGLEPEDLLVMDTPALIVPGNDISHALSAARYLEECLPGASYWNVDPSQWTRDNVRDALYAFFDRLGS